MQKNINDLFKELSGNLYDLKCEALINQALKHGIRPDDFVVINDGRFFREYRNDVYALDRIEDAWRRDLLQLHLSRSGLYDLLPEGLFHQPAADRKANESVSEMAAASRRDRKKEMATRKFFQPLENSLFLQRVQLETEEENLITGMNTGLLNDYFFHFWGFPAGLNKVAAQLLVLLLPYAHEIAGDLTLMQQCLEILLQEKVEISPIRPGISFAENITGGLGSRQLGNDMVCGNSFTEDYPCLQYVIGPLQNTRTTEYLSGGGNELLLHVFNNYFAPAEADIFIEVEVDKEKAVVRLDAEEGPILGYSCIL